MGTMYRRAGHHVLLLIMALHLVLTVGSIEAGKTSKHKELVAQKGSFYWYHSDSSEIGTDPGFGRGRPTLAGPFCQCSAVGEKQIFKGMESGVCPGSVIAMGWGGG